MLVRGVVDHEIHDETHAPAVESLDERIEVREAAEFLHDVLVVADVVAVVLVRRAVDGVEPDYIDAERSDVIDLFEYAAQIADAVAVRILEAPGIYLIDDTFFPPCPFHESPSNATGCAPC